MYKGPGVRRKPGQMKDRMEGTKDEIFRRVVSADSGETHAPKKGTWRGLWCYSESRWTLRGGA